MSLTVVRSLSSSTTCPHLLLRRLRSPRHRRRQHTGTPTSETQLQPLPGPVAEPTAGSDDASCSPDVRRLKQARAREYSGSVCRW